MLDGEGVGQSVTGDRVVLGWEIAHLTIVVQGEQGLIDIEVERVDDA